MTPSQRILRNALVVGASQPISWTLTVLFTVIVARNVGPVEWGEWGIALAVGIVVRSLLDFGVNTMLLKEIPRRPEVAARYIGAVLGIRLGLAPIVIAAGLAFGLVVHYPQHTMVVLSIVVISLAVSYIESPVTFGLQAIEKMHISTLTGVATGALTTIGSIVLVKFVGAGIIAVASLTLVASLIGGTLQWVWLSRDIALKPIADFGLMRMLLRQSLPFWGSYLFFTIYVWIDGIMLSLMTPTREVGWYNVGVQVISSVGFLPYAVTTAVFPALSASYHNDSATNLRLAARSFRFLVALSLPMSAGLILVSQTLIAALYGPLFAPAALNVAILALTLPPAFVATLVNAFVIAADGQARWTWLMGGVCVINPLLNLVTIPYFHHAVGNGAVGAGVALVITDSLTAVAAVRLVPPHMRVALVAATPALGRALLATGVMVCAVLPVRELFPAIPVVVGIAVFFVAALALNVFSREEVQAIGGVFLRTVRRDRTLAVPAAEILSGS